MDINTALLSIQQAKQDPAITPVAYAAIRADGLASALTVMASDFGVTLRTPLQIDSNGDIPLVAVKLDETGIPLPTSTNGCASYGTEFAALLSRYSPRTGMLPTSHISAENGWCSMNHFEVERMVLDYANRT